MTFTPENTGTVRVTLADYQRLLRERESYRVQLAKRSEQVTMLTDALNEILARLRDPHRGVATPGILALDALRAIEKWDEDRSP